LSSKFGGKTLSLEPKISAHCAENWIIREGRLAGGADLQNRASPENTSELLPLEPTLPAVNNSLVSSFTEICKGSSGERITYRKSIMRIF
jgi:hypothetical protein